MRSFFWFDYETFGISPTLDRPAQFAGIRTDAGLDPVEAPVVLYCRPPFDYLPAPAACRLTGLSPETCERDGVAEPAFIDAVVARLGAAGTCAAGYNSVRFDDEFTRHTLFRNLREPYGHEWRHGNSRWDLLDVVRLTRALRPDGIEWPFHADGRPSNRLEDLAAANELEHVHAHDALSDVYATIAMARLIRTRQPRLFDYALTHRDKRSAGRMLDPARAEPVLHVSGRIPASRSHLAVVLPIAWHPVNRNAVIVVDLADAPEALLALDAESIRARVFRASGDGPSRLGLKQIRLNRCPVVAPLTTLRAGARGRAGDAERLGIDLAAIERHHRRLDPDTRAALAPRLRRAFAPADQADEEARDVEATLYGGAFLGEGDRARLDRLLVALDVGEWSPVAPFDDPRIEPLLLRYRARHRPDTLSSDERDAWAEDLRTRLVDGAGGWRSVREFDTELDAVDWEDEELELRASLIRHRDRRAEALALPAYRSANGGGDRV